MDTEELKRLSDSLCRMDTFTGHQRSEILRAASAILSLIAERDALLEALEKISQIENKDFGSDWEEIEEARSIARAAITKAESK